MLAATRYIAGLVLILLPAAGIAALVAKAPLPIDDVPFLSRTAARCRAR